MDFKSALIRCSEVLLKIYKGDLVVVNLKENVTEKLTSEQKEAIKIVNEVAFAPVDLTGVDNVIKQIKGE